MVEPWSMKGELFGPCNCDWGCPCNFDAPPTYGNCEGIYVFFVREGRYGNVSLDGLKYAHAGSAPGAVHEGNMTSVLVVDDAASPDQREALETLWKSGEGGLPFDIWNAVTSTWLDTIVAPIELELAGINSSVRIGAGELCEIEISRVKNPVTGDEEEMYLDKPTGFMSTRSELGMSTVFRFDAPGLAFDASGKYAEYAEYEYSGPPG
jgi:hypothetical protein